MKQLQDRIVSWDEFVNQVAHDAVEEHGGQYNKWALYIPALISELTHAIGTRVGMIIDEPEEQTSFMDELLPEVNTEDELPEEQQIRDRYRQIAAGKSPPRSMDPFRTLQVEEIPEDLDPTDDPDLIV